MSKILCGPALLNTIDKFPDGTVASEVKSSDWVAKVPMVMTLLEPVIDFRRASPAKSDIINVVAYPLGPSRR